MSFIIEQYLNTGEAEETQSQEVQASSISVGRGTGNTIHLDDLRVSLQHAAIEQRGDVYVLRDLDSANGTFVNRQAIHEHQLADNDEIQLGAYTLHWQIGPPAGPVRITLRQTVAQRVSEVDEKAVYLARYTLAAGLITKQRLTVLGLLLVVGGFLMVWAVAAPSSDQRLNSLLSPGKVSTVHRLFEDDCSRCHQNAWQNVDDTGCKSCHDLADHQMQQALTPRCADCHQEHQTAQENLRALSDSSCTQCHANLHRVGPETLPFKNDIKSFISDHPEFAVSVTPASTAPPKRRRLTHNPVDGTPIKLNHQLHLKPLKLGATGSEQLTCDNCHQLDEQGAYMRPITFEEHCMQCHQLQFDPRFPRQTVPHEPFETVHTFLQSTFTQYVLHHLEECQASVRQPIRWRPGQPPTTEEAKSIQMCVKAEVEGAETFLFKEKTCKECHTLTQTTDHRLPTITPVAIPQRWFPHSVFNHQTHLRAAGTCEDCHGEVKNSRQTQDVLLPGIVTCQTCHKAADGARTVCVTCHTYHAKPQPTPRQPYAKQTATGVTP
jgi:hypothetical protein